MLVVISQYTRISSHSKNEQIFQNWKDQIIVDYLPELVKFLFFHFMWLLFTSPRTNKTY